MDSEQECSGVEDVASDLFRARAVSQVMKDMMLKMAAGEAEAAARGCCGCWVMTEDVDAVKLKVAMPGLGKEHVKVWAEPDVVMIEAEGVRDPEFDDDKEDPARYKHRIEFPKDALNMDEMKAEMKHGALKVTLPKIKLKEERTDVCGIKAKIKREESVLFGITPGVVVE